MSYVPAAASARTTTIGVAAPFLDRWFLGQALDGVEDALGARDVNMLLHNIGTTPRRRRFFGQSSIRHGLDGLIVLSLPLSSGELAALRDFPVPVVLVGVHADGFSSVGIDDVAVAIKATKYLIGLGHQRIALLSDGRYEPIAFRNSAERRHGYRTALLDAGIAPDPALEVSGPFGVTGGATAVPQLLAAAHPPTAIFAEFDQMAYGALQTLKRLRLRVPDDVSVIGVDDHELSELMDLTTIRQPVREQGSEAARLLLELIEGGRPATKDVVLPTELVARGTTSPPGQRC